MSVLPELRLIVATLIRSVPGMFNVLALMSIVFYVYGVAGYHLFRDVDPTHWRTLGISLLSLFRIVTLEDWTDIMYAALDHHWWAWAYFVSFVVVGTFVVINLFIAVVINSLDEAKQDRLQELAAPPDPCRAAGGAVPDAGTRSPGCRTGWSAGGAAKWTAGAQDALPSGPSRHKFQTDLGRTIPVGA